jgi:hypothetical protein
MIAVDVTARRASRWAPLVLCALISTVQAEDLPDGEVGEVVTQLAPGVRVSWTRSMLIVERRESLQGASGVMGAEKAARAAVEAALAESVGSMPVRADLNLAAIEGQTRFAQHFAHEKAQWGVGEVRYHTSGDVTVIGEVGLGDLLRSWVMSEAGARSPPSDPHACTGLVIDARGVPVQPVYAPRVVGAAGEVLYASRLDADRAPDRTPATWVVDPAHPASARAGASPCFARATAGGLGEVAVGPDDTRRILSELTGRRVMGEGALVIVVDPR